jgi:hypothetical protein
VDHATCSLGAMLEVFARCKQRLCPLIALPSDFSLTSELIERAGEHPHLVGCGGFDRREIPSKCIRTNTVSERTQ